MKDFKSENLDWNKMQGLLPAIIQNVKTGQVLILAYMNQDALNKTLETKLLTLYSRSKKRLWQKGESSGNTMTVQHISTDCDNDSLLIQVIPNGPACHLGSQSCFSKSPLPAFGFLAILINLINERAKSQNHKTYTTELIKSGINRCAQKVGEEAVETVIAAVSRNKEECISETADLIFHLLVLLEALELSFFDIIDCLEKRHGEKQ